MKFHFGVEILLHIYVKGQLSFSIIDLIGTASAKKNSITDYIYYFQLVQ